MSGCQNDRLAKYFIAGGRYNAGHFIVFDNKTGQFLSEMKFTATLNNGLPHVFDNRGKNIGAYMRVGVDQNIITGSVEMKKLQDSFNISAFARTGVKFPVGKSASAAFAETIVRFGIQTFAPTQGSNILFPCADIFSTVYDNRL